jgi:hypothetical protein
MRTNSKTTTAVSVKNTPIIWASLIMVLIVLFVTQFAQAQVQNELCIVPSSGNPCPPPVSQIQKPSRPIGTNGAYVECNPNIIINPTAGCRQEDTACHGYYVSNESAGMYTGWNMFTCGALALIIGFLFGYLLRHHAGNGTSNSGNKNSDSTTNRFFPENNHALRNVLNLHFHEAPVRTNSKKSAPESK